MHPFTNKTALITGATSGIGKSIAIVLAKNKCNLILVSRNSEKMRNLQSALQEAYLISVHILPIDLSESNCSQNVFDFCKNNKLQVDILINNAGFGLATEKEFHDIGQLKRMLTLHVTTLTVLCSLFANEMVKKQSGYILNISSITAIIPAASTLTYSATKHYIYIYSKLLHEELKRHNVVVSCALPGATETSFDIHSDLPVPKALKKWYVSADFVAGILIQGLVSRKRTIIPGWQTKLLYILGLILPKALAYRIHKSFWVQKRYLYLKNTK